MTPVEFSVHGISCYTFGVPAGNIAACRSYLSAATRHRERTPAVSMVSLAQVLGFIFGPGKSSGPAKPNSLKGNLATPSENFRFWRIIHFRAVI